MNNQVEKFTFPNKIVKFRFSIEDGNCRIKLSKLLAIIVQKYNPSIYYIKQLDDIRMKINSISEEYIRTLIEAKKNDFEELYKEFLEIFSFWKKFPDDLKSYILISFKIEYNDLLKDENQ